MTRAVAPPAWAESLLRLQLEPRDREIVTGDLLEMYRDRVEARGRARADAWYVLEALDFTWRVYGPWIILFGLATSVRTGFDWLQPPADFAQRSMLTTAGAFGTMFAVGLVSSWRFASIARGVVGGIVTAVGGGMIHLFAALSLLVVRHDPVTLNAIAASGGLSEALTLPFTMILPAAFVAGFGGTLSFLLRGMPQSSR